jgi:hypothetical protein
MKNSLGSPIGGNYNRYPDPLQLRIKKRLAGIFSVDTENIFLGNGSDEAIDLLFRIFCEPRIDNILIFPPTYGMYEVSAGINDVEVRRRTLDSEFQITSEDAISGADANTRLAFFAHRIIRPVTRCAEQKFSSLPDNLTALSLLTKLTEIFQPSVHSSAIFVITRIWLSCEHFRRPGGLRDFASGWRSLPLK